MMSSRIDKWLAVSQIVSSIAVVISIVYLVSQYNRSLLLNSTDVDQYLYESISELNQKLIDSPELASICLRAREARENLSEVEKLRFLAYEHIFYDLWELLHDRYDSGIIDEQVFESWNTWFRFHAANRPRWGLKENLNNYLDEESGFRRYLEKILEEE